MRYSYKLFVAAAVILFSSMHLFAQDYPRVFFMTGFNSYASGGMMGGPDWSCQESQSYYFQNQNPLNITSIYKTYSEQDELGNTYYTETNDFNGYVDIQEDYFIVKSPIKLSPNFPPYRISKIRNDGYYLEDCLAFDTTGSNFIVKAWHQYNDEMKLIGSILKKSSPLRWTRIEITLDDLGRRAEEFRYVSPDSLQWTVSEHNTYLYSGEQYEHSYSFEKHYLYMPDYILNVDGNRFPYLDDEYILSAIIHVGANDQGEWYDPWTWNLNFVCDTSGVTLNIYAHWNNDGLLDALGGDDDGPPSYYFHYGHTSIVPIQDDLNYASTTLKASPNPTREKSSLQYSLPKATPFTVCTYNIKGQLLKREDFPGLSDKSSIEWFASDSQGSQLPSGMYIIRMVAGDSHVTARILVVK